MCVASADGFAFGPIAAYSAIEAARESAALASNPRGDAAIGRRLCLAFTGALPSHINIAFCALLRVMQSGGLHLFTKASHPARNVRSGKSCAPRV